MLEPGDRLGHYEVLEPIGKGGMGEVYRARDTKLGRDVAIKVLPDEFSRDDERLRRFQREAKVLASLNHPNIASIYGLEHSDDRHYLVLELVPGETLAERIARGPIPLGEALEIAAKVVEALEDAHEKGIVHRDLKPANIKLTPDEKVKVLDFGLAKAFVEETPGADSSMSPTITRDATRIGTILGTAAYMSPEQAKGKSVDKRSDIFAFGAVLYEMLTGKRAFAGEDVSETLAFVITKDVDFNALPKETPSPVRRLLRRALEKNRRERLADAGDARLEIKEALSAPAVEEGAVGGPKSAYRLTLMAAVAASIVAGLVVWNLRAPEPRHVTRLELTTSEDEPLFLTNESTIAISPDGRNFIYVSAQGQDRKLIVRPIDALSTRTLVTSTSGTMTTPFVSPNGEWVGYRDGNELRKVPLAGGPPVTICRLPGSVRGASWGVDGSIVFGTTQRGVGLYRVPASGGEPLVLTTPEEDEARHLAPDVLPGGRGVLFSISGRTRGRDWIGVHDFDTGEQRSLFEGDCCPRYAASGHIVYARDESLWAIPFDSERLELVGESRALPDQVFASFYSANYALSRGGVLLFAPSDASPTDRRLVWVDRAGEVTELGLGLNNYTDVDVSPDGTKLAVWLRPGGVWVYDVARGARVRLSEEGNHPVWSPDGSRLGFAGPEGLYSRAVGGSERATLLIQTEELAKPGSWARDGSRLAFSQFSGPGTGVDVWVLSEDGQAEPLLQTAADEDGPTFSPDGQWLAYVSNESGENEVYLQPYPGPGAKIPISVGGGRAPVWSPKGDELFYRGVGEPRLYSVRFETQPVVSIGEPQMLFEKPFFAIEAGDPHYDVSPDGQRFLMIESASDRLAAPRMIVVLNWHEELERLVPANN